MKKFLVVLVVVAMACMSSVAFAADVAVSGSIEYRMRNIANVDMTDTTKDNKNVTDERVRLNIDAKAGDALSGRVSIENDWDTWGRFESVQGGGAESTTVTSPTNTTANLKGATTHATQLALREAWIGFKLPGTSVGIKGGHMLLQLGNGWWFRSMKFGSDAWVAYTDIDALHLGFVDIKVNESTVTAADDTDAYAFVATYKMSDTMSAGINFTTFNDRKGRTFTALYGTKIPVGTTLDDAKLQNLEAHFAGAVGSVKLNAEIDMQMGDATYTTAGVSDKSKFKGNQVVLQANIPMDALTINATVARGSGGKSTDTDEKEYISLMDGDMHYTVVYEYLVNTAARDSFQTLHTGFANTTAFSAGAAFNVTKNLMVGADAWMLQATQKVTPASGADTNDLGLEIDAKVNWKLYENLTFNTVIGYFMPGDAYKLASGKDADKVSVIQSVLAFKF